MSLYSELHLDDFVFEVYSTYRKQSGLRFGQHVFNKLSYMRPELARIVTASEDSLADPFYCDENLPAFWELLEKEW